MPLDKSRGPEQKGKTESMLARTIADYQVKGLSEVSAPEALVNNPGKTLAETMSDEDIETRMRTAVELLDAEYAVFQNLDAPVGVRPKAIAVLENNLPRLTADIKYLRSIRRLPEVANFNPRQRYPIE